MTEEGDDADWSIWRYRTDVSVSQAVALSLNIDPLAPRPHIWMAGRAARRAFFVSGQAFAKRLFLAEQEVGKSLAGPTNWRKNGRGAEPEVKLATFARWARSVKWGMPTELLELAGNAEQSAPSATTESGQATNAAHSGATAAGQHCRCCSMESRASEAMAGAAVFSHQRGRAALIPNAGTPRNG